MLSKARSAIGGLLAAAVVMAGSVAVVPQAEAASGFYGAQVYQVGGKKNYWNNRYYNNRYRPRYYSNGWNNNWWVGPAIGFGAGVLLGSALTAPRYYAPTAPRYYGDRNAYCARKYRSYNPYTGTYTGYDGRQHYCRIP